MERIRVLIADDDTIQARRLAAYISSRGFEARTCTNGKDARSIIMEWHPRFVLADLMLLEGNALELIDFIKNEKSLRHKFISVLVMSGHNVEANVRQSLQRGAKDYIVKPFTPGDILNRLVFHSRSYRKLKDLPAKDYNRVDEASLMLHLTDLVLRQALGAQKLDEILYNLTRMVSIKVDGVRCSIIHVLGQQEGRVVMSNDNRKASGIVLDLYKYPEVVHVQNTQTLIAIENLEDSAELRHVRARVKDIAFNSMIVCPVTRYGQPFGVLSLRLPPEKQTISDNEIRFVEIVSHVVSLVLSNELHKNTGDFWMNTEPGQFLVLPMRNIKNS